MSNQKKRGYQPPVVTTQGHSFRFDSRDIVHSVGIWRSPEILNAVIGNIVGLFLIGLFIPAVFWVRGNFIESGIRSKIYKRTHSECIMQYHNKGENPNYSYCAAKATYEVNKQRK